MCNWRLFHSFGKWTEYENVMKYLAEDGVTIHLVVEEWQRRECLLCGYVQREKVRPS